jgi:carbamoyl-phosphate synthase large subunit
MPPRRDIDRILIIGSGPIVIGQAAEFDYSGTQALKALKRAGYHLIVVNSNSATVMTDPELSDAVYIEPLTPEFLEAIIARERPDALLPTLGGQTALNLAVALAESGVLERYGVQLIGASIEAIRRAEDRDLFKKTMLGIGLEVPASRQVANLLEAFEVARDLGYPLIARPSFTLGGTGGGVAYNAEELERVVARGLIASPAHTVLLEESVIGWKEYELEVMRDHDDNALVVCSIENLDPMGVHTGDSVTVAPAQTLTDREYQRMRDAALAILRAIGVDTGGSNIQFAVNPLTGRMVVIEMNPRVSRSSALASKATGYPIAKVAALLAVGYRLDEIPNDITRRTTAAFEPTLDYVVVKVPRFQLEKFPGADPLLSTQMKSVGEVMAIGRTFKEALGKALRSLELDATPRLDFDHLRQYLANPTPERLAYIYAALRRGYSVDELSRLTQIDRWFITEMDEFVRLEEQLRRVDWQALDGAGDADGRALLLQAKAWGFSDRELAELSGRSEREVRALRQALGVLPVFKMVDTCAAEFEAATPYFFSTYGGEENEARRSQRRRVLILGSGPNRIGQGIEFDYANVHAVWALQEEGFEVIMVNSNPETVSTDYDTADRLYFEPLTAEDVLAIVANEEPEGVVVGFGGQTPLKLARRLVQEGVPLLGMGLEAITLAEDREQFGALLDRIGLKSPPYGTAFSVEEALRVAEELGYPVLVRPSFILGGRAVEIVDTPEELRHFVAEAARVSEGHPVLVDRFLSHALELDVDIVSDGREVWVAGLMEQIEEAGVHSGDSACVLPPVSLSMDLLERIEQAAARLVRALGAVGLVNIQMAVQGDNLFILEANPRASRTVPYVSKAIGVPLAKLAAKVMVGRSLRELLAPYWPFPVRPGFAGLGSALRELQASEDGRLPSPWPATYSVKEVLIPFERFPGATILLGPEMRSTGEVMGLGSSFAEAFAKSQIAAGNTLPTHGLVLASLADADKREGAALVSNLADLGFQIVATDGTARALRAMGVPAQTVPKVGEGRPDCVDLIVQGRVALVVNTPSGPRHGRDMYGALADPPLPPDAEMRGLPLPLEGRRSVGNRIRAASLEHRVPYISTLAALRAATAAIRLLRPQRALRAAGAGRASRTPHTGLLEVRTLKETQAGRRDERRGGRDERQ